ncbi:hypothetical protein [Methylobacterium sp. JK268]
MCNAHLSQRLKRLEAARTAEPVEMTSEELAEAARRYRESLDEDVTDPAAVVYWSRVTLQDIAADWNAMLRGAPPPWK